jgi:hypothetical protein
MSTRSQQREGVGHSTWRTNGVLTRASRTALGLHMARLLSDCVQLRALSVLRLRAQ